MISEKDIHANNDSQRFSEWLKPLAQQFPDAISIDETTFLYLTTMNLDEELAGLEPESMIYDVGCANGGGTIGLQEHFPQYHFVGVDLFPQTVELEDRPDFHFVQGAIEDLATKVREKLAPDFYPPKILLLRNTMQLLHFYEENEGGKNLIAKALRGINDALASGGKALIYDGDEGEESYSKYLNVSEKLGLPLKGTIIPLDPLFSRYSTHHPFYLKLEKS